MAAGLSRAGSGYNSHMTEITETPLPGLGVRHEFECASGDVVGVVSHHAGPRELVVYDRDDRDSVAVSVTMSPDEARVLADLLGGSTLTERLDELRQQVAGLSIEWLPISADSPYAGRQLGDAALRTRTGISIVAILRGDTAVPAPGPEDVLEAGDTAVAVGTVDGLTAAAALLAGNDT